MKKRSSFIAGLLLLFGCTSNTDGGSSSSSSSSAAVDTSEAIAPPKWPTAPSARLTGVVKNAAGEPIAGASVKVGDALVVQTDAEGRFSTGELASGEASVDVSWGRTPCVVSAKKAALLAKGDNTTSIILGPSSAVVRKTLVINFDPIIESHENKRLHQVKGWNDPRELTRQYTDTFAQCSGGEVVYKVVEWIDADEFPLKKDGFRDTDESYLSGVAHQPDGVDYAALVEEFDLVAKVNSGRVDEVIAWGAPNFGYWESHMIGPTAYWVNSTGYVRPDLHKNFVVMGLNYERKLGEAIHSYGHRVESILKKVYGRWDSTHPQPNAWELFSARETDRPSSSGCGRTHFPPNGTRDYDYANDTPVTSRCASYLEYPDLDGGTTTVSFRSTWKVIGDAQLDFLKYWYGHLPRAAGRASDGKLNDWWKYVANFNAYPESR
jgi:hypothetical protein